MIDLSHYLSDTGPLAQQIKGYAARPEQLEMAAAVSSALQASTTLVVEAGTGTGKTFAYLLPALLSGRSIIISTGTRHLQDQLFHRDLPVVRDALQIPVTVALLKGRANYLCDHRLTLALMEGRSRKKQLQDQLQSIRDWAGRTQSGDVAELVNIPEDSVVWPMVTSTPDNCLGAECGSFNQCYVMQARRKAMEAEVVVINHHLLFADMTLKEEGFGELLPKADAIIVDEAHQLPETATRFFGISLTSRQLTDFTRDCISEYVRETGQVSGLPDAAKQLETAVQEVRLAMGKSDQRAAWKMLAEQADLIKALAQLQKYLSLLTTELAAVASLSRGLEKCWKRGQQLAQRLLQTTVQPLENHVHWFETFRQSFRITLTPLDISTYFQERRQSLPDAWVFTSATLSVNGQFEHFNRKLGLTELSSLQLNSPFDYQKNALLYLPEEMPEPSSPAYSNAFLTVAQDVLRLSQGRAFLLFTSYRALHLAEKLLRRLSPYPLLVQGDAPRNELLLRFREQGNAVLLGTSSFWEGVDVRGEALSCVIIDKLPFASPGDPVIQARIDALREQGGNPFMDEQLPNAVINLKQGVGRLIRDVSDRGVLTICDPRLTSKRYGRIFLDSLPPMRQTRQLDDVAHFFTRTTA
ncbi:MAG: ATP-dependent DNA helicase [Gammaproteobacteria bacterium]